MRRLLSAAFVAASLCHVSDVAAQEGLFSEVAMESVFSETGSASVETATRGDGRILDRVTGASALIVALEAAGFDAKKKGSRVEIELRQGEWKLPISMDVQIEHDRILCTMTLVEISDDRVGTKSLLNLLASGDPIQGSFFGYDAETKLITLRLALSNRSMTARQLKKDLMDMAATAEKKADLWWDLRHSQADSSVATAPVVDSKPATATAPAATQPAATNTTPATNTLASSLVGKWTASAKGGSTFAIRFTDQNQFQLVHLQSGKSRTSKGSATRSGSEMTLAGDDGNKINCTVTQNSADKFAMGIKDSKGIVTTTLQFKRAK